MLFFDKISSGFFHDRRKFQQYMMIPAVPKRANTFQSRGIWKRFRRMMLMEKKPRPMPILATFLSKPCSGCLQKKVANTPNPQVYRKKRTMVVMLMADFPTKP